MKPRTPLLQLQGLAGEDCLQLVGPREQQPAVWWLIQQFSQGLQALNRQVLGFVKEQQHLALAEIKSQIAQNPIDRSNAKRPAALGHPLHQVQGVDTLANVDVVSSSAFSVLSDLRAVQLRDQVLQDVGLLGSRSAVEIVGPAMIQCLVEISPQ